MKKIATMLAVGVVALGASAQADQVESTEYALITIPVVAGNNLIGISVEASNTDLTNIVSGLVGGATVKKWTGAVYEESTVGQLVVSKGDSFFVEAADAGTAYELGVAPSESSSASKTLTVKMDIVAPPFANSWSLEDLSFTTAGGDRWSTANKVHVWNGSDYDHYYYKYKAGGTGNGWRNKNSKGTVPDSFGAGQAVFIELGNGSTTTPPTGGTVTFAAPH